MHTSPRALRRSALRQSARRRVAAALAAATAGFTGMAFPAAAGASPVYHPHPRINARVIHRTLVVWGSRADEKITLRVPVATPEFLTVDLGDDGVADARINRSRFDKIIVLAGRGDDTVRIDETAGVAVRFTDTTPTSLRAQAGNDTLLGALGAKRPSPVGSPP
jgi:Ca2+-binding RTX toxin-like protein